MAGQDEVHMSDTNEKYLRALVYFQVQAQTGVSAFGRPEQLLTRAGFSVAETAEMLGKSPNAISKALSRAKASGVSSDA